jgi:hypothetical protein
VERPLHQPTQELIFDNNWPCARQMFDGAKCCCSATRIVADRRRAAPDGSCFQRLSVD